MGGMAGAMGTVLHAPVNTAALSRKIVYDGETDLIVKDVDPIAKQVVTFIQDVRGYIAEQSTTGSPGNTVRPEFCCGEFVIAIIEHVCCRHGQQMGALRGRPIG